MKYVKSWTDDEFYQEILIPFNNQSTYSHNIPYDHWRKLVKSKHVVLSYSEVNRAFMVSYRSANGPNIDSIYFDSDNKGFGEYLYDKFVARKKSTSKEEDNMSACSATEIATAIGNVACGAIDASKAFADLGATSTADRVYWSDSTTSTNTNWCDYNSIGTISLTDELAKKSKVDELEKEIEDIKNKMKEKEDNKMKGFNFDFGPCGDTVRISMYGLAIQNISGEWVSYNTETNTIMNVDIINFPDGGRFFYKMPAAIKDVKIGDIVIHNRVPMIVTDIGNPGVFEAVDVRAGEQKIILATRSPWGFDFVTKVVSLFGNMMTTPDASNPFGNMLPLFMMGDGKMDKDTMLMFMMMNNGGMGCGDMMQNPMMLYMLMKDNKDFDPMILMMMAAGRNTEHKCCS